MRSRKWKRRKISKKRVKFKIRMTIRTKASIRSRDPLDKIVTNQAQTNNRKKTLFRLYKTPLTKQNLHLSKRSTNLPERKRR